MQDYKSVYQISADPLKSYRTSEIGIWGGIYNYVAPLKTLVDRTGFIKMPFNISVYEKFKLPELNYNFQKTFDDVCLETANKIILKQNLLSKPIYLFYSGGIDSVGVLISFLKILSIKEAAERIKIVMTSDSIMEYPWLYYKLIRSEFDIISGDNISNLFDKRGILVTGGQGDKIFGTDNIGKIYRQGKLSESKSKYSKKFIVDFWTSLGIPEDSAKKWYELLDQQIKFLGVNINTNLDFLWWFNFSLEWQSEYFLFPLRSRVELDPVFYDDYMLAFYDTVDHQLWSINNTNNRIKDTWNSYKFVAKDFIYSYTKDADYRDFKIKGPSLNRLFHSKKVPLGIDCNLKTFDKIEIEDIYNARNSFC